MNILCKLTNPMIIAWRNIVILTALFCVIYALPNFVILPRWLATFDVRSKALWMSLGFTLSGVILLIIILLWLRHDGITLAEIGWGGRTNLSGIILGLGVGAGWLAFSRLGISSRLPAVDITEISLVRVLAGIGTAFSGGLVEESAYAGSGLMQAEDCLSCVAIVLPGARGIDTEKRTDQVCDQVVVPQDIDASRVLTSMERGS